MCIRDSSFLIALGNDDSDGDGKSPFVISSAGVITVNDAGDLNYESDSSYSLLVVAYDDVNAGNSDSALVTVNLNDVDEFDVTTPTDSNGATNTIAENSAVGSTVGVTASASDADGTTNSITYSVSAQSCAGIFTVSGATGVVTVATSPDYESTGASCTVTILATSADSSTASDTFTVAITNIAPTLTDDDTGTVSETAANSATVVDLGNSGDSDGLTWSITAGNLNPDGDGNSVFAISNAGVITVNDADDLDYETTTSYSLTVRVTDGTTNSDETITVTVTNVAPALTDDDTGTVSETATATTTVVDLANTGDDDGLTWSIQAGNTGSAFAINSGTGVITVNTASALDFETTPSYSLTVRVTDGTTNSDETITVTVTNVAPALTDDDTGTVSEVATASTTVVDLDNTGDDDSLTWSITAGNLDPDGDDNKVFAINSGTGVILSLIHI